MSSDKYVSIYKDTHKFKIYKKSLCRIIPHSKVFSFSIGLNKIHGKIVFK